MLHTSSEISLYIVGGGFARDPPIDREILFRLRNMSYVISFTSISFEYSEDRLMVFPSSVFTKQGPSS